MIIERHREIPIDELSGAPAFGQDPVLDGVRQLKRMHPRVNFCFGVAHTRFSSGGGRETIFISPLFPTKNDATSWQSDKATLVKDYLEKHTRGGYGTFRGNKPLETSIEEVKTGDIYTRLKLPDEEEKSLTHGRRGGTPSAPTDGMKCISSNGLKRRHR